MINGKRVIEQAGKVSALVALHTLAVQRCQTLGHWNTASLANGNLHEMYSK